MYMRQIQGRTLYRVIKMDPVPPPSAFLVSFIHSPLQSFIDSRSEGNRRWGRESGSIDRLGELARNPQLDVIQLGRAENVSYPINCLVLLYYGIKFLLLHYLSKDKKRLFIVPNEDEVVYPVISFLLSLPLVFPSVTM